MLKLIDVIFSSLSAVFHLLINGKIVNVFTSAKNKLYSHWVKHEFSRCGKNCHFGGFSLLLGAKNIKLGSGLYIGKQVVWELYNEYNGQHFTPQLELGDNSSFGDGGHITCINHVKIGNGVRIGRKVLITDNSHGASEKDLLDTPPNLRPLISKGEIIIEDNVWIGEMVCIMPGVTIGKGSIIGANAVVTKSIPPYCVAGGNPAQIIKNLETS